MRLNKINNYCLYPIKSSKQNENYISTCRYNLILDTAEYNSLKPSKEWKGRYDANGGYLVVRKDGEIVCYHFYNRNDIEDYLYHNTRFERGSRTRHNFGSLFREEDGDVYIRLNLQIRFKK